MAHCSNCTHIMVCETPKRKCAYYRRRLNRGNAYFPRLANVETLCEKCANSIRCAAEVAYAGKEKCLAEQRLQRLKQYEETGLSPEEIKALIRRASNAKD